MYHIRLRPMFPVSFVMAFILVASLVIADDPPDVSVSDPQCGCDRRVCQGIDGLFGKLIRDFDKEHLQKTQLFIRRFDGFTGRVDFIFIAHTNEMVTVELRHIGDDDFVTILDSAYSTSHVNELATKFVSAPVKCTADVRRDLYRLVFELMQEKVTLVPSTGVAFDEPDLFLIGRHKNGQTISAPFFAPKGIDALIRNIVNTCETEASATGQPLPR